MRGPGAGDVARGPQGSAFMLPVLHSWVLCEPKENLPSLPCLVLDWGLCAGGVEGPHPPNPLSIVPSTGQMNSSSGTQLTSTT